MRISYIIAENITSFLSAENITSFLIAENVTSFCSSFQHEFFIAMSSGFTFGDNSEYFSIFQNFYHITQPLTLS